MFRPTCLLLLVLLLLLQLTSNQVAAEVLSSSPITRLGLRLADQLTAANRSTFVISPYSAHSALNQLALGARGPTLDQLEQLIGLSAINGSRLHRDLVAELSAVAEAAAGRLELRTANMMAIAKGFTPRPAYRQLLESRFLARVEEMDFARQPAASVQRINSFVSRLTGGQIPRLLAPTSVGPDTRLVLLNALYFKATWQQQFDPKRTVGGVFTTASGRPARAQFMTQTLWGWLRQDQGRQLTMLELPYSDRSTSMLVILPFKNSNDSSGGILNRLLLAKKQFRLDRSGATWTRVTVQLPRFKIRSRTDLTSVLPRLGVRDVFDPVRADLRGISAAPARPPLYVGLALQEAVVEVTEEGTKAAAATVIGGMRSAARSRPPPPPYLFRADRPFAFIIYNRKLGLPLFMGQVDDPTAAS